jgi:hypothetical protein
LFADPLYVLLRGMFPQHRHGGIAGDEPLEHKNNEDNAEQRWD